MFWGYPMRIWSSVNGQGTFMAQIVEQIKSGKLSGSYHRVTVLDAVEQGIVERIQMRKERLDHVPAPDAGRRQAWLDEAHALLEAGAGRPLPRLHDAWRQAQEPIAVNVALIRALRPLYRTAILSNADASLPGRLRALRLDDLCEAVVCSADVGMAKPDPAIYRLAVDDLAALRGGLPAANAARIEALVAGGAGDEAGTAATLLNAGAAIYVAGLAASYAEGIGRARHVLGSGAARTVLEKWRKASVSTSG